MENNQQKTTTMTFPIAAYQTKDLAWTISFLFAAVVFPALLAHTPHNQWITGTIVNAILFLSVWRIGIVNASFVAFFPSSIALLRGLLPAPMAIAIPWIIISNFILILVFYSAKKYPKTGIILASLVKFLFLFAATTYFLKIADSFLIMMQWPQLFTALAGGLIAFGTQKFIHRTV